MVDMEEREAARARRGREGARTRWKATTACRSYDPACGEIQAVESDRGSCCPSPRSLFFRSLQRGRQAAAVREVEFVERERETGDGDGQDQERVRGDIERDRMECSPARR